MAIKMPNSAKADATDAADRKAAAFIGGAGSPPPDPAPARTTVNMRFDVALLRRVDEAARLQGISRTAWLHVAASKALD